MIKVLFIGMDYSLQEQILGRLDPHILCLISEYFTSEASDVISLSKEDPSFSVVILLEAIYGQKEDIDINLFKELFNRATVIDGRNEHIEYIANALAGVVEALRYSQATLQVDTITLLPDLMCVEVPNRV
jgi:hypothetical protein